MLILGILLVVAGAIVGLGKMPRAKKARARRRWPTSPTKSLRPQ